VTVQNCQILQSVTSGFSIVVNETDVVYRMFQKNGPLLYFDNNFSKCGPILTIFHRYNKKFIKH